MKFYLHMPNLALRYYYYGEESLNIFEIFILAKVSVLFSTLY